MPEVAYKDIYAEHMQGDSLTRLTQIAMLKNNWDGYGAEPLPRDTIFRAQRLIRSLHVQPEIFPTAADSLQIEYEKNNGDYLELQFTGQGFCKAFRCISGNEEYFSLPDNSDAVNTLVDEFQNNHHV